MHHGDVIVMLCFVGLGALLAFAQTAKHMSIGPYSAVLGLLQIPIAVAILWQLSRLFGWWTILIFIGVSFAVGYMNGIAARKGGRELVYSMQPILGTVSLICAVLIWML